MPRLTVTPFGRNAPPLAAANGEPPPPLVTKMGFMPFELAIVPVAHMSVLPFTEIRLPATTPTTMSALPYFQFELLSPAEFGPTSCGPKWIVGFVIFPSVFYSNQIQVWTSKIHMKFIWT
jgi:hypothetical protein